MEEYWLSSRRAFLTLSKSYGRSYELPIAVPLEFQQLRPWVNKGWEMVLLTAELVRHSSALFNYGAKTFSKDYENLCIEGLKAWGWEPKDLQFSLETARKKAIEKNLDQWLSLHKPFPEVIKKLKTIKQEGLELSVLTTKSQYFTQLLLKSFALKPKMIIGHESGSKINVLLQLINHHEIKGFIEDRRVTLETVLRTPKLASIPCYLADWGYLKPTDRIDLTPEIQLLDIKTLETPLAAWN